MTIEVERKEDICETCEGKGTLDLTFGWKEYSFHCPSCHKDDFLKGIGNINMSEKQALLLISIGGQAGE